MIYCDNKVMQVDFKVHDSRDYTFFIDEEICIIKVEKGKHGGYAYSFKIDNKTATDFNKKKKKTERKWTRQSILTLGGGVLVFLSLFFGTLTFQRSRLAKSLDKNGIEVPARITITQRGTFNNYSIEYLYRYQGANFRNEIGPLKKAPMTAGIPLKKGYEFMVLVDTLHPDNHELLLDKPEQGTLGEIMNMVLEKHLEINPNANEVEKYCLVPSAYQAEGLDGLSDIYHQSKPEDVSPDYNTDSFLRLIRDTPFIQAFEACKQEKLELGVD